MVVAKLFLLIFIFTYGWFNCYLYNVIVWYSTKNELDYHTGIKDILYIFYKNGLIFCLIGLLLFMPSMIVVLVNELLLKLFEKVVR